MGNSTHSTDSKKRKINNEGISAVKNHGAKGTFRVLKGESSLSLFSLKLAINFQIEIDVNKLGKCYGNWPLFGVFLRIMES